MGIHGLMKLLSEECPDAIKELADMENLTGRKVAIDASMALYQFLVAVRSMGNGGSNPSAMMLMNEAGEVTSHIQGMFNRTIKMLSSGIKPIYVFDGKAPELKGGELAKRSAKRAKAMADLEAAKANEDAEDIDKFSRRLVKVTKQHNLDCQELLNYMGVPYIIAPCEAEAQCAELAKKGKVYGTATEDMDALTFRTPKLLRKLTFSQGKDKQPIIEIDMDIVLKQLGLTYEEFVDLCILCGCDYCNTIKGIGPKTALKLIKQYHNIEEVIIQLKKDKKYDIPSDWYSMRIKKSELNAPIKEEEEEEKEVQVTEDLEVDKNKEDNNSDNIIKSDIDVEKKSLKSDDDNNNDDVIENKISATSAVINSNTSDENIPTDINIEVNLEILESTTTTTTTTTSESSAEKKHNSISNKADVNEGNYEEIAISNDNTNNSINNDNDDDDEEEYEIIPPLFQQARKLFTHADVTQANDLDFKWTAPDEEGLRQFLVEKMGFNLDRVNNGIKRLQEAQMKKSQQRMDSFFSVLPKTTDASSSSSSMKRKADDKKGGGSGPSNKKSTQSKGGGGGGGGGKMGRR